MVSIVCLAAASVLYYAGTGLDPVPALVWLAPLPLLWLAPRVRWWTASAVSASAWIAGSMNLWTYFVRDTRVPVALVVAFLILGGVALAGSTLAFRALMRGGRPLAAVLAAPAVWVTAEYLVSVAWPHGSFWSLAYTQASVPLVMQPAAVAGTAGVTFLLLLVPAAVAAIAHVGTRPAIIATTLLTVAAAAVFGTARLVAEPSKGAPSADGRAIRVGLVAVGHPQIEAVRLPGAGGTALLDAYLAGARDVADGGAKVIVMPEAVFRLAEADLPALAGPLSEIARRYRVTLVIGAIVDGRQINNIAVIVGPDGDLRRYTKQHLIPGHESRLTPGNRLEILPGDPAIGVAICKDLDFTDLTRGYRRAGAALMAVPSWDFDRDGWLHGRMAITRGIETGVAIARPARTGTLTASDSRGRVIAEAAYDPDGTAKLVADLPAIATATPYVLLGDWLAWLCVLGTAAAASTAVALRARRRRISGQHVSLSDPPVRPDSEDDDFGGSHGTVSGAHLHRGR